MSDFADTKTIEENSKKRVKVRRALLIGGLSAVTLFIILPILTVLIVLEVTFGGRHETETGRAYRMSDFPSLSVEEYSFPTSNSNTLQGYLYTAGDSEKQGLIVMAHGFGGGGQNTYMDIASRFASAGYYVFSFDATANDNSTGIGIGGFEQGIIDLDHAISFAESIPCLEGQDVYLFGHSWGAYSASCVLKFHPEVKAVIAVSGMNSSLNLIESYGVSYGGNAASILMPYFRLVLKLRFENYADITALDGFTSSDARIMIIHGADDTTIKPELGYQLYWAKYSSDPRFTFILRDDRAHDDIMRSDEAIAYIDAFNEEFRAARDAAFPDGASGNEYAAWRLNYLEEHLDRTIWADDIDDELWCSMLAFLKAA